MKLDRREVPFMLAHLQSRPAEKSLYESAKFDRPVTLSKRLPNLAVRLFVH